MNPKLVIRNETPTIFGAILDVSIAAFETLANSQHTEQSVLKNYFFTAEDAEGRRGVECVSTTYKFPPRTSSSSAVQNGGFSTNSNRTAAGKEAPKEEGVKQEKSENKKK